jgi:ligand-binding SRPBCC domain-containing protein
LKTVHFIHESIIRAPPEAVFAFHERPDALRKLVPPWERVEVVQPPASLMPGTRVLLRMRVGPLKLSWEAEHTRYEKNVLFEDRMLRGPFKKWLHTHHTLPAPGGGTLLRDEVEYELPLLFLPGLPLVLRRLRRMFEYRHRITAAELA